MAAERLALLVGGLFVAGLGAGCLHGTRGTREAGGGKRAGAGGAAAMEASNPKLRAELMSMVERDQKVRRQ